ncbi:hypothetical protein DRO32_02200 [Candidatus Bathyarchaeota archaeon]|nr:MAG: hypothetical protein DRO32_02200 [Candidatus Bathyarchaeota archaeon]
MGQPGAEDELARWYFVLKSPVRLRIIRLLGERGPLSFKELKRELGLGVGTIYYHLDVMSDLVAQDEKKRYLLNERGAMFFSALMNGTLSPIPAGSTLAEKALGILLLSPFFKAACERPLLGIPLALAILVAGGLGSARMGLMPILMFYARTTRASLACTFLHYLAQWGLVILICELLCLIFYRRRGAELELMIAVSLANLPMALFPYIYVFLPYGVALKLLTVFHAWTVLLVCSAVSMGKGIRLSKALPVGFTLLFLNLIFLASLGLLTF